MEVSAPTRRIASAGMDSWPQKISFYLSSGFVEDRANVTPPAAARLHPPDLPKRTTQPPLPAWKGCYILLGLLAFVLQSQH
jgi:hypothetical protein